MRLCTPLFIGPLVCYSVCLSLSSLFIFFFNFPKFCQRFILKVPAQRMLFPQSCFLSFFLSLFLSFFLSLLCLIACTLINVHYAGWSIQSHLFVCQRKHDWAQTLPLHAQSLPHICGVTATLAHASVVNLNRRSKRDRTRFTVSLQLYTHFLDKIPFGIGTVYNKSEIYMTLSTV